MNLQGQMQPEKLADVAVNNPKSLLQVKNANDGSAA
jgi:hypothetical protein